jgi:hypothetical protein
MTWRNRSCASCSFSYVDALAVKVTRYRPGDRRVHDREGHVRLRESLRQQLLELTLALAAGGDQQLLVVGRRQVRRHQPHRGQVDLAGGQRVRRAGYRRTSFAALTRS